MRSENELLLSLLFRRDTGVLQIALRNLSFIPVIKPLIVVRKLSLLGFFHLALRLEMVSTDGPHSQHFFISSVVEEAVDVALTLFCQKLLVAAVQESLTPICPRAHPIPVLHSIRP